MNFGYTSFLHSMLVVMIDYFSVFFHLPYIVWTKSPNLKKKIEMKFREIDFTKVVLFCKFYPFWQPSTSCFRENGMKY